VGVRKGYEKVTSAFVFLVSLHFRGRKFFVVGENVKPNYFSAIILLGLPQSVGPKGGP